MKKQIEIYTVIKRSISDVWKFWTEPEHITKWNAASADWHCPKAENDLRPGGKFVSRMESKDGKTGFDFEGIYDEVIDEEKISYTMPDGRYVVTIFYNLGRNTEITTLFDPETANSVELQKRGWQSILDNFRKYAESF